MSIEMDISQVVGYSARLRRASGSVGKTASAALRKTALDIEGDAKILAPVDTGNLMNSISTTITGDGRRGQMSAEVGPTAEYGIYVHEGTSRMAGRPFLADAFDRRIPMFEEAVRQIAERDL